MQALRNMAKISITEVTELTNQNKINNKKVFIKTKTQQSKKQNK